MASLGGNIMPAGVDSSLLFAGLAVALSAAMGLAQFLSAAARKKEKNGDDGGEDATPSLAKSLFLFCYSCFLKPHGSGGDSGTQQDALESFYEKQAGVYDATRKTLLKGREDMLALAAAQLVYRAGQEQQAKDRAGQEQQAKDRAGQEQQAKDRKRVWVDVGGGTGWNIEAMAAFVDVPAFFSSVYLVDFSPSLCAVARKRFARLGWANVRVICEDARKFRLVHEAEAGLSPGTSGFFSMDRPTEGGADLITMSYSLSMMPDFYAVVDSLTSLLAPNGIIGAVDFYVQSQADFGFRNYTGGQANRHTGFLGRTFWRSWFELDRVSLEAARRDYLEYRFGTVLSVNARNRLLGAIPYYIWLGCHKTPFHATSLPHEVVERVDAMVTESPYTRGTGGPPGSRGGSVSSSASQKAGVASPATAVSQAVQRSAPEMRSKAFQAALANLSAKLPLPASFYQNHHWRIYYDDGLAKHRQFRDEYIYAFTWEDSRVDERLLQLSEHDVVLAITSAGDNVLSYALQRPARIHAVDLNPAQNHLLELKVAAYAAQLPYDDFWQLFGEGRHPQFRELLVSRLSPHLSSQAFQYWLGRAHVFKGRAGRPSGLYHDTGGSRNAIRLFRYVSWLFGCRAAVQALLEARTLNEQREIWHARIRPALLSPLLSRLVVSQERFLWAALGVPTNQLAMILQDYDAQASAKGGGDKARRRTRSHAVWQYMVDTLDPVVESVHLAADNPYYYVCLDGRYARARHCHPDYLAPAAHAQLSRPGAFDGLRIHTDEIEEVMARLAPASLTVAVIMDSMDWFDREDAGTAPAAASSQIAKLNRALCMGGRVLLRSSARAPWYLAVFERLGFVAKRHGDRQPGVCIDRVNMYASCWICTKVANLPPPTPTLESQGAADIEQLVI